MFGHLEGLRLAYIGDSNNVAHSLIEAGALSGVDVVVASPAGVPAGGRRAARRDRVRGVPRMVT